MHQLIELRVVRIRSLWEVRLPGRESMWLDFHYSFICGIIESSQKAAYQAVNIALV